MSYWRDRGDRGHPLPRFFAAMAIPSLFTTLPKEALDKAASLIAINQKAMVDQGPLPRRSPGTWCSRSTTRPRKRYLPVQTSVLEAIVEKMAVKRLALV